MRLQEVDNNELDLLRMLLVMHHEPVIIFEAGTHEGDFAIMAGKILRDHHTGGKVFTADPFDFKVNDRIKEEGLETFVEWHQLDFIEMMTALNVSGQLIDFAFLDSGRDGNYDGEVAEYLNIRSMRYRHYEAVKPHMARGGIIAVDDMANMQWYGSEAILAEADIYLKGGRGLTLKQM